MRRVLIALGVVTIVGLVAAAGVLLWGAAQLQSPGPATADTTVIIPRGSGIGGIAARLGEAGVIRQPAVFEWGARWFARRQSLKAGEYLFAAGMTPQEIIDKMMAGDTVKHRVTVAEGLTTAQVLDLVRHADGLEGDLSPETVTLPEGRLLPETYTYSWGDSREAIVRQMTAGMDKVIQDAWPHRGQGLEVSTPEEALVLASIVEKESAIPSERPHIARVFMNRLKLRMPLQADPTIIYALTQGKGPLGRPLQHTDLSVESPYNTYTNPGLPPGPIANPGRESIIAVLQPADGNDLYFVADGTGGHAFAATLAEHNRNVARLRRLEAAQPAAGPTPPQE